MEKMTDRQVLRALGFALANQRKPAPALSDVLADAGVDEGRLIAVLTDPAIKFSDE